MIHPTNNKSLGQKLLWHLRILAGAVIITLLFSFVFQKKLVHEYSLQMLVLSFAQLEIFIWIGTLFFRTLSPTTSHYKRKIIVRLLLFYIVVLLIALGFFLIIFSYNYIKDNPTAGFFTILFNSEMKGFISAILVGFAFGSLFFFYVQWDEALKREQKLTEEKLIFQYETLKRQVNPHFLFNSLNTLSSLVGTNTELSELFIQKLSAVYRYILENMEKELVPVSTELAFVNDYFYLQKIRDQKKIDLVVKVADMENAKIPPVSLQMLVENALKHNSSTRDNPLVIIIHNEDNNKLVVKNKLQRKSQMNDSSKIGLKNLNERCKLILNREIEVEENREEFVVKIPVKAE